MDGIIRNRVFWAGVLLEAPLLGLLLLGDWPGRLPLFLLLYFAAFCIYLVTLMLRRKGRRMGPLGILVLSALFRLTLLPATPTLSHDIHRFAWDGKVQAAGINPYSHPPDSPELAFLRSADDGEINHPEVRTIYPPAAQVAFIYLHGIPGGIIVFKAGWVALDLLLVTVLLLLLRAREEREDLAIIYAWNPLAIVEVAGSGHMEPLPLLFLFLAYLLAVRRRPAWSGAALGISILGKYFTLPLLPVHLRDQGWQAGVGLILVMLLVSAPYVMAGSDILSGLLDYGSRWEWNGSLFRLVQSRIVVSLLLIGIIGYALLRRLSPLDTGYLNVAALILLGPVVHPWYVIWILPFLCFHRNAAYLLLSGLVVLSYHAFHIQGAGPDPWIARGDFWSMEYVPFYVILLGGWICRRVWPSSSSPARP